MVRRPTFFRGGITACGNNWMNLGNQGWAGGEYGPGLIFRARPCLAVPGRPWPCLASPGGAWPPLAVPGRAWPCLSPLIVRYARAGTTPLLGKIT